MRAKFWLIKIRFLIVTIVKKLLLNSVASGAPSTIINSLDQASYSETVNNHIGGKEEIYEEKFEYYEFPESYPPQFRRYKSFERKSVYLLQNVVTGPLTGAIWLPEGRLLQESVGSLGRAMGWGNALCEISLPMYATSTEREIVSCPPTGYYHWLLEVMPNLISAVEKYPDAKILLHSESPGYIKEALAMLFGDEVPSRLIESDAPIQAARIVMTQFEAYSGFVRLEDIEKVRRVFLSQNRSLDNYPPRFYVSRSRTPKRGIGNEKEVEEALFRRGVEVFYLEQMEFGQQIDLFSHAQEIIAPHGAGLANLVWAKPNSRVLEIFPHRFFNDCYARLAVSRSLEYHHVTCRWDANSHGAVDIDQIAAWLDS